MTDAKRDNNYVPTLIGVSSADGVTPVTVYVDPTTHRVLTQSAAGSGTVTSVSVVTANGVSGSVATATTTPAITLTLGAITPTTVNGLTITANGTNTLTIQAGKTLTVNGSLTLAGTDGKSLTLTNSLTVTTNDGTLAFGAASKTLTVTDSATINTNTITLAGGEVITFSASNALSLLTSGTTVMTFPAATDTVAVLVATQTLTNKRINPRIGTEASSGTSTPTADTVDQWTITALAAADAIAAPTGTPVDGQKLIIRIKDNGTARALTWNAIYRASTDLALPTTTVISKTLYCGFIYNSADTKWDLVAYLNNF